MAKTANVEEAQEQDRLFEAMPYTKTTYTLTSGELHTGGTLAPGLFVSGRFQGVVKGVHFDRVTEKTPDGVVPQWRRKHVIEVIVCELDTPEE